MTWVLYIYVVLKEGYIMGAGYPPHWALSSYHLPSFKVSPLKN